MVPADSGFSHGVVTPANHRWLHTTGQAGWDVDGNIVHGSLPQCRLAFENITRILTATNMSKKDLVKLTAYLSDQTDIEHYRIARDEFLEGARPASTVLIVAGFAIPGMRVEIEAIASAPQ